MKRPDYNEPYTEKIAEVLRQFFPKQTRETRRHFFSAETRDKICDALETVYGYDKKTSFEIGFHLSDWLENLEFLFALHLNPSAFSKEQIAVGITHFLIHAPNHIAAAAALVDAPVSDVFETGCFHPDFKAKKKRKKRG